MKRSILRENTRLIAEFMGYEIISYKGKLTYNGHISYTKYGDLLKLWQGLEVMFAGRLVDNLIYPFHEDFRYLIPIIQKIEESGHVVCIAGISYKIYPILEPDNVIVSFVCGDLGRKTLTTYELIVAYIKELKSIGK